MMPTPETLSRHELAGLDVEVVDAPNPDLVGVAGRVVRETEQTLVLRGTSRERQVPKAGTTFEFALEAREDAPAAVAGEENNDDAVPAAVAGDGHEADAVSAAEVGDGHEDDAPAGEAGDAVTHVTVEGSRLLARPARRTETRGEPKWR